MATLQKRVEACYNQKFSSENAFDYMTRAMIDNIAAGNSIPDGYLLPSFLCAISHFLNKSKVLAWKNFTQPCTLYTMACGFTSTNKTRALDIVKDAMREVELAKGVPMEVSKLNQSATVESLMKELSAEPNLIQTWDEMDTWAQSMGLYKAGGSAYDRSLFCTLYNCPNFLRRQLKSSEGGECAVEPVLNLTGCVHPRQLSSWLDGERNPSSNNDGLYARFLVTCAEPVFDDADTTPDIEPSLPSMGRFLYAVTALHEKPALYVYAEDAVGIMKEEYNAYQAFLRTNHHLDGYMSGVIGKAKGQLHRLAMVAQAACDASSLLVSCGEDSHGNIDRLFVDNIQPDIPEVEHTDHTVNAEGVCVERPVKVISAQSAERAIYMMRFFIAHKRLLSGYATGDFLNEPVAKELSSNLATLTDLSPQKQLVRKILCEDGAVIYQADLRQKWRQLTNDEVSAAFQLAVEEGLGTVSHDNVSANGKGRKSCRFIKKNPCGLSTQDEVTLMGLLEDFGISLPTYRRCYSNTARRLSNLIKPRKLADHKENTLSEIPLKQIKLSVVNNRSLNDRIHRDEPNRRGEPSHCGQTIPPVTEPIHMEGANIWAEPIHRIGHNHGAVPSYQRKSFYKAGPSPKAGNDLYHFDSDDDFK